MTSHDDLIGQERFGTSDGVLPVLDLMREQLGEDLPSYRTAVCFLVGKDPVIARQVILYAAHRAGRHSNGRCPEQCPEF